MAMNTNSNNTNEEMMNNQAQDAQAAVDQQQAPAAPEVKQHWYDKPLAVGRKIHNSKPAKWARRGALIGLGIAIGYTAANGKSDKAEESQAEAEEPAIDTTATEETVE